MASEGQKLTGIAVRIIAQHGGRMGRLELRDALALDDAFAKVVPEKRRDEREPGGRLRWVGQLHHFVGRFAADLIGKKSREWFLKDEGMRMTHDDDGKGECLPADVIALNYKKWTSQKRQRRVSDNKSAQKQERKDASTYGREEKIADYIKAQDSQTGKWFEELVRALLRGIGYERVVVVGGPGDGGIDVVAYKDELGAVLPRVKVQVKHNTKGQQVRGDDILRLEKVIHDGEIGLFVTASSFSPAAKKLARDSAKHLELVDIGRFVELCEKYWSHTDEEDRDMLPPDILNTNNAKKDS